MALTVTLRMLLRLLTILVLLGASGAALAGAVPPPDPGALLISAGLVAGLLGVATYAHRQNVVPRHSLARSSERARSALIEPARDTRTASVHCDAAREILGGLRSRR